MLGPLLTRCGHVRLSLPGGDDFGSRPIDMHIAGLEAMGATFKFSHGYLEAFADRLHGADITFDFPSVGATENLLTAAVLAEGTTRIDNAAREPEIADLCDFLVAMGADITGIGTSTLVIERRRAGRAAPRAPPHGARPDPGRHLHRRGRRRRRRADDRGRPPRPHDHGARAVHRHGARRSRRVEDRVRVAATDRMRSIDVATLPYPGIATDYKPLIITMLSVAEGVGIVTENLYPGRFRYVEELQRLGADVRTSGHHAVVRGVPRLSGAPVRAHDIRAGAAMVVAGLAAEGETLISGVHHIDRGYDDLVGRLARGRRVDRTGLTARARSSRDRVRPGVVRIGCRSRFVAVVSGAIDAPLGQGQQPGDHDDRSGDEEDLVPSALVGERRTADRAREWIVRVRWLNVLAMREQVEATIEVIRPALQADGGDIVLHDVDEVSGIVSVELVGACGTCPASTQTLKAGIERIMRDRVDGVTEVVNVAEALA